MRRGARRPAPASSRGGSGPPSPPPELLEAIKKGDLSATVFQNPEGQGAGGVRACVDHLSGKKLAKEILIPFELVTKANVDKFVAIANRVYIK